MRRRVEGGSMSRRARRRSRDVSAGGEEGREVVLREESVCLVGGVVS